MLPSSVRISEVGQVVEDFNRRFGEMEKVTACPARAARAEVLGDGCATCLEELVWLVKCWIEIQGVTKEVKEIVPRALLSMGRQTPSVRLVQTLPRPRWGGCHCIDR